MQAGPAGAAAVRPGNPQLGIRVCDYPALDFWHFYLGDK